MGGLILGIILVGLCIFLLIKTDGNAVTIIPMLFAVLCLVLAFEGNGKQVGQPEMIKIEHLVPIDGYYILPSGAYVTESKVVGNFDKIEGGVPINSVGWPPVRIITRTYYKPDFWTLNASTKDEVTIRLGDTD